MKIKAVIGANYGDEGKGMTTYALSKFSKGPVLNILTNGGPQRGHTVDLPNGCRFVFKHFGSGALAGADTFCGKYYILNPALFVEEYFKLKSQFNISPLFYVHPKCRVTTPYDMILNQMTEENRSGVRHGSVGLGIFETIRRYRDTLYNKSFIDLITLSYADRKEYLDAIAKDYLPGEVFARKINSEIIEKYLPDILSRELIDRWLCDFDQLSQYALLRDHFLSMQRKYTDIVCESGQGLLLDQDNKEGFPHLTPSHTGVKGVIETLNDLEIPSLQYDVYYVSRTYLTRHGAGNLLNECIKESLGNIALDRTNVSGNWQGSLRYAPLDMLALIKRISNDFTNIPIINQKDSSKNLVLTHTNEVTLSNNHLTELNAFDGHVISTDKPWIEKDQI